MLSQILFLLKYVFRILNTFFKDIFLNPLKFGPELGNLKFPKFSLKSCILFSVIFPGIECGQPQKEYKERISLQNSSTRKRHNTYLAVSHVIKETIRKLTVFYLLSSIIIKIH